jgi:general L-amino acid transport system permease protein
MKSLVSSLKFRRAAIQVAFIAVVVFIVVSVIVVGNQNIQALGIASGFGFLERTTGWPVSFSIVDVSPRSTYAWVLYAGLLNTMLVGFLTLLFSTMLGLLLALLRISSNLLMNFVGTTYIEVFRNVPVILQVFFWYAILTHLPGVRGAYELGDVVFLSNRGLELPMFAYSGTDFVLLILAAVALICVHWYANRKLDKSLNIVATLAVFAGIAALLLYIGRAPGEAMISVPELRGLRFKGGLSIKPEFSALLIGLVLFGAAYIGEIIRGGLLSVDRGKLEAAAALGLNPYQINRLIRIPLAFRAMLPSLTNQYIWLMKATTVGIAIGFPDYFAIISTSINQSGQTLELLGLLMGGFILVNYSISFVMNRINERLKLKGRS